MSEPKSCGDGSIVGSKAGKGGMTGRDCGMSPKVFGPYFIEVISNVRENFKK